MKKYSRKTTNRRRYTKRRYTKHRYTKRRNTKRRYTKRRYTRKYHRSQVGGVQSQQSTTCILVIGEIKGERANRELGTIISQYGNTVRRDLTSLTPSYNSDTFEEYYERALHFLTIGKLHPSGKIPLPGPETYTENDDTSVKSIFDSYDEIVIVNGYTFMVSHPPSFALDSFALESEGSARFVECNRDRQNVFMECLPLVIRIILDNIICDEVEITKKQFDKLPPSIKKERDGKYVHIQSKSKIKDIYTQLIHPSGSHMRFAKLDLLFYYYFIKNVYDIPEGLPDCFNAIIEAVVEENIGFDNYSQSSQCLSDYILNEHDREQYDYQEKFKKRLLKATELSKETLLKENPDLYSRYSRD